MKVKHNSDGSIFIKEEDKYLVVNEAGYDIINAIKNFKDLPEMITNIVSKYNVSQEEAENKIKMFSELLKQKPEIDTKSLNLDTPLIVQWKITNLCNLKCKHCYVEPWKKTDEEISTEEREQVFNKLYNSNLLSILFTGGECFILKDTIRYMKAFYNSGVEVKAFTNGILALNYIDELELMKGNLLLNISIDGNEEEHDYIRGKGNFEKTVSAIKEFTSKGIKVAVNVVINKINYMNIFDLIKPLSELGVSSVQFSHMVLLGSAKENREMLALTDNDYKIFEDKVVSLGNFYRENNKSFQIFYKPLFLENKDDYIAIMDNNHNTIFEDTWSCCAGITRFTIDSKGNATPCSFMKEKFNMGNLVKSSLDEVWNSPARKEFQNYLQKNSTNGKCVVFKR